MALAEQAGKRASPSTKMPPTRGSGMDVMQVTVGERLTIVLEAAPGTGYDWDCTYDPAVLQRVDKVFCHAGAEIPVDAVEAQGGTERFVFHALREGETTLTFAYRGGRASAPVGTRQWRVTIVQAASK